MLHTLRKGAKSLVAKLLIGLLIASFAVWGIGDMFSFRLDSAVAEVGETEVKAERYAVALQREQRRLTQEAGEIIPWETITALGLDNRVLSRMVRDATYAEELRVIGIAAPDEAVAEAIRSDERLAGTGGSFSPEVYRFLLSRQGLTPAEFEDLTRELIGQRLIQGAVAAAVPPPGAATRIAAWRGETRTVATLTLTPDMADDPGEPDDAALQAWYDANAVNYAEPERRWIRYIHVDPAAISAENQPDEETVRQTWEAEKDLYATPGTRTVERLNFPNAEDAAAALARIEQGDTDFDALIEENGLTLEDVQLGEVSRDDLPEVSAGPIFEATETGVIGPVPTPLGSSLVRITAVQEGSSATFEEVKDTIATRLATAAALDSVPDIANRIEESRAAGTALDEVALEARLPLERVDGIARDGSLADGSDAPDFARSETFIDEAFEALDLEERPLLDTPEGGFLLVMVDRIEAEHLQPLEEIRDRVVEDWKQGQRLAALEKRADALAGRIADGESLDAIAEELGLEIETVEGVDRFRDTPELPQALVTELFQISRGNAAAMKSGNGVVLATVQGVAPVSPETMAQMNGSIEQVLGNSLAFDQLEYFARSLESEYGAVTFPDTVEEVLRRMGGQDQGGTGN